MQPSWIFDKLGPDQLSDSLPGYEVQGNDLAVRRVWHAINGQLTVEELAKATGLDRGLIDQALHSLLRHRYITRVS